MSVSPHTVLSLAQLMRLNPTPDPALIGPALLPAQGILFVGGEPKVGKSLLVANLALALAAGSTRTGFDIPAPARVLLCQFELPLEAFAARLAQMRQPLGSAADENLWVDTRATGHLLSTHDGLNHFLTAARTAQAQVLVLDPLYSAHDQDENDTRAMAALCQSLLRLRQASQAALIVVHHVRKSVARHEVGSAFRGSSALHAVGDSYLVAEAPSNPTPWSCVFSSDTLPRCPPGGSGSILPPYGLPPADLSPPQLPPVARSKAPMSRTRFITWGLPPATISSAIRSCAPVIAPSAPPSSP